jgi:FtsP/CotA-like multicopper oxidase with cupredoxin domain
MDASALSRRDVLKIGAFGGVALALPLTAAASAKRASELSENRMPRPYREALPIPALAQRSQRVADGKGRPVYELTMQQFGAQLVPGYTTTMWGYRDTADPTVTSAAFPGPTIVAQRGRPIVVRFINDLPPRHPRFGYLPTTSVHLHGHASRPQYDGYAEDLSTPGQFKDYVYENNEDARTIWYHDHAVHHTAENVAMGLAGQYHVTDPNDTLPLPRGRYDVPLTVTDVAFTSRGQLLYDDRSDSGPMGDVILVNGKPWPLMSVERRKYRFRLLNASIARGYRLRLSSGRPMWVITTDGGLLRRTVPTTELRIGMAERYGFVIDFADYPIGTRVELRNLGVENAIDYDHTNKVMAFQVVREATDTSYNEIPDVLVTQPGSGEAPVPVMDLQPTAAMPRRRLVFERGGSEWTINDLTWHDVAASGFTKVLAAPATNAVEVWTLENGSGGWFHPVHLHLVDFKVLDRNGRPPRPYEMGPKDVVYLGENETIRLITRFAPHQGKYMIHCHNNSHEDHDMMGQMQVGVGGPDPVTTAPPRSLPAPATTVVPGETV